MKRLFTLLLISFAALSCEMIDEKLDDLLGKRDWVVFAEGTELTANVPSKQTVLNYKFESTLDWEVKTDAEWLEIDPMSGKAGKDIKIQIKVAKNKDKEGRTGYADLTLSNDESYRITINQAGEGDENDEGTIVDVPANQIWYTSVDGEIVEPYSGEDNNYADAFTTFGVNIVSNTYVDGKGIIEFEGDVTIIGDYAFYGCSNLTSVTIGNGVTTIGDGAFYNCTSLTSVTIGDSVTTIGEYAFAACYSLTSVTIPDSVTTIGDYAFGWCSNLQEFNGKFVSEDGRCLIIDGVLNSFAPAGLTEYTIPDSVTTIGNSAFSGCSSLTSVTIGDSVTTIGDGAFNECSSLTSVTIPDSVTTIGDWAFCGCSSLTSVTIPDSVTTIGDWVFAGCSSLTSVTIPDSVITIGFWAFAYCDSLASVTIPDSVTSIGDEAFRYCYSLTSVYCKATTPPVVLILFDYWCGFYDNAPGRKIYVPMESVEAYKSAEGWSSYADAIVGYDFDRNEEVVQPEQPEEIPNNQIWYTSIDGEIVEPYSGENNNYADALTTFGVNIVSNTYVDGKGVIEFDGDVTTIGYLAFRNCYSLTSVTIPNSVTIIGEGAFACCYELTSATIGDSVTVIGMGAFGECDSLTNVNVPNSVTKIGESAFHECHSLTNVTIPDGVTVIEMGAFFWCTNITSVTIGNSVTTIEMGAFSGCHNLQEFNGKFTSEDGRCLIIDGVLNSFAIGCSATEYTIPDGVTSIGGWAFYECSNLTSVTIGDSVTTIGECAFAGCDSLTSITIPDSVTTIGDHVFQGCSSLTSVTIPDSVTTIGEYAFQGCSSLTSVTIPDSVTIIGERAFEYCSSLTSVTIPDSVTTIGFSAFEYCSSLTSVYCKATTPPVALFDDGYWGAFNYNCKIYVPMESVEAYKSAEGWSDYANAIVGYNF